GLPRRRWLTLAAEAPYRCAHALGSACDSSATPARAHQPLGVPVPMTLLQIVCDNCGAKYRLPETFSGAKAKCKQCNSAIDVAAQRAAAQAPAAAATPAAARPARAGSPARPAPSPARSTASARRSSVRTPRREVE